MARRFLLSITDWNNAPNIAGDIFDQLNPHASSNIERLGHKKTPEQRVAEASRRGENLVGAPEIKRKTFTVPAQIRPSKRSPVQPGGATPIACFIAMASNAIEPGFSCS